MDAPGGAPGTGAGATRDDEAPAWTTVVAPGGAPVDPRTGPSTRRVVAWVVVVALIVIVAVSVAASSAARVLAEGESVRDAADRVDRIADALVEPALTDALVAGDPEAAAGMDAVVTDHVLSTSIARVKIWDADGRVVWSDEDRLVGQVFPLTEEDLEALASDGVEAEVSDLEEPENVYERDEGRLLEAYRAVRTVEGTPLLLEVYFRYDEVLERSGQLWSGFAGITIGSIVLVVALLVPVFWQLLRAASRARRQREALLQRALDASADERRRIAGALHDGVVQDLVATSFAAGAQQGAARRRGDDVTAEGLGTVADSVRGSIAGLRTLLVDLYPPNLARAGLGAALDDLARGLRGRGVDATAVVDDDVRLDDDAQRLVFRVAQEALQNVAAHARASTVRVRVAGPGAHGADEGAGSGTGGTPCVLTVTDDGVGFDPGLLDHPEPDHFGLRVLADLARDAGAVLDLATAPGGGTTWRLAVPVGPTGADAAVRRGSATPRPPAAGHGLDAVEGDVHASGPQP